VEAKGSNYIEEEGKLVSVEQHNELFRFFDYLLSQEAVKEFMFKGPPNLCETLLLFTYSFRKYEYAVGTPQLASPLDAYSRVKTRGILWPILLTQTDVERRVLKATRTPGNGWQLTFVLILGVQLCIRHNFFVF
jgi:hypothetical protein